MRAEIRHSPSFAAVRCHLDAGEQIQAEAGAMMAHSAGIILDSKMRGGLASSLKRSVLGGESFFISTYTASANGGWIDIAPKLAGDIKILNLDGGSGGWIIERGSWLASESSVTIDAKWQGFKSLFGGEGGFMVHAQGSGQVLASSYGAVETLDLVGGEMVVIDTGHVLAFADSMNYELKTAGGQFIKAVKSGEGFVFHFQGPGRIMIQSRNTQAFLSWVTSNCKHKK